MKHHSNDGWFQRAKSEAARRTRAGFSVGSFSLAAAGFAAATMVTFADGALALHEPSHGASKNMRLLGHDDTQGRRIYNGHVRQFPDGRWIALVGHHGGSAVNPMTGEEEPNGNSFVDVTDPANPKFLLHLPSDAEWEGEGRGGRSLQTCSGDELPGGQPGRVYMHREVSNNQHELWDVTDPENPEFLHAIIRNTGDTHKNWWECSTGIAYLTHGVDGWKTRVMSIWDLSDPEIFDPEKNFIRYYSLPNSQPDGSGEGRMTELHEPLYHDGRVYMAYGTREDGILQILDNDELLNGDWKSREGAARNPTNEELLAAQIARLDSPIYWGVHTAVPMLGVELPQFQPWAEVTGPRGEKGLEPQGTPRDFVISISEATGDAGCDDRMQHMVTFVDITDPQFPYPISNYYVNPEGPEGVNFCERGGRFGAHSMQWNFDDPNYGGKIAFFSWFNGGVRMVDIRDPYNPVELGWFIPDANENTSWGDDNLKVAVTNNVDVDDRGYVYLFDRAGTGMHIVEPTGEAKQIAGGGGDGQGGRAGQAAEAGESGQPGESGQSGQAQ